MIHIGKNNVVAKIFGDVGWKCVAHNADLQHVNVDQNFISISAFSPMNKSAPANLEYEVDLFSKLKSARHVLYVSTIRTLEAETDENIRQYVQNKKRIEALAKEHFHRISIIRLPNIIDRSHTYRSRFQETLLKNLTLNEVRFDVSARSKFNFLTSQKFKEWLANQTTFSIKDYNFANRCDVSAKEIAEIIKSKHSICHECYNENRCIKLQMPDDANFIYLDDSKITYQDLIGG